MLLLWASCELHSPLCTQNVAVRLLSCYSSIHRVVSDTQISGVLPPFSKVNSSAFDSLVISSTWLSGTLPDDLFDVMVFFQAVRVVWLSFEKH